MKRRSRPARAGLVLSAVGLLAILAAPAGAAALDLPPTEPGRYVYDLAKVFSPSTIAQAQAMVAAIKDRTQAEIAIVSWPSDFGSISPQEALVDGRTIMDTWASAGRASTTGSSCSSTWTPAWPGARSTARPPS